MTPPPAGADLQAVERVLGAVRDQVATALWLSAGMVFAVAAIVCTALRWRRPALALGLLYSASLCFVHNGQAQLLGPIGGAAALAGFLWPARKGAGR